MLSLVSTRSSSAFTLIEVLVAILIFSLGLIAAFVLTSTATSLSIRSKQEIIATNLLREQLEIAKNIRDTNFLALRKYNSLWGLMTSCPNTWCPILTSGYWIFGLNYSSIGAPVSVVALSSPLLPNMSPPNWTTPGENAHKWLVISQAALSPGMTTFRYCIDSLGRYRQGTVCGLAGMSPTPYYGWILLRPLTTVNNTGIMQEVAGGTTLTAYLATTEGGYREYTMSTILTDFKK